MVRHARGALAIVLVWATAAGALGPGAAAPAITGDSWINSPPLSAAALGGRVVLVEFWTYG